MGRLQRLYLFAVCGAIGGVVGSYFHQSWLLHSLSESMSSFTRFFYLIMLGTVVGAPIGFFPALVDGLGRFSCVDAVYSGMIGAACGTVGGMLGMPVAEALLVMTGGGVFGRAMGFAVLGVLVGVSEAANGGARAKFARPNSHEFGYGRLPVVRRLGHQPRSRGRCACRVQARPLSAAR